MHKSVLLQETIDLVSPKTGGVYIDATCGAGGHTLALAEKIGESGRILAIDQDATALEIAKKNLKGFNITFVQGNFADLSEIATKSGFKDVDGVIADIGVSSMQFDQAERGFSFSKHARLDMRMDQSQDVDAEKIVNEYSADELTRIFKLYGEEPMARRIANEIIKTREIQPIIWTDQLSEVVRGVKFRGNRNQKLRIDPATKVFQALRIEVNKELDVLSSALPQMVGVLKGGGRMAIISFHSLEDRIVKRFIEKSAQTCVCPPDYPKCVCGTKPTLKKITRKPVMATAAEISDNPRSRSAKLRVAEKI
jgi:16S rRNA (cytosine1402-N4)-methyltransferase